MKIAIIDYDMGNIKSVQNSLKKIGYNSELVSDPYKINDFEIIILPGVGAFPEAMKKLRDKGFDQAIKHHHNKNKPIIGICLGMQLLFSSSLEYGKNLGLNIIEGEVLPMHNFVEEKIPHMGWNSVKSKKLNFTALETDYYFVHSFFCAPKYVNHILFETKYGIKFCSAVNKDNRVFGYQFHPEKSQKAGLELLKNTIELCLKRD